MSLEIDVEFIGNLLDEFGQKAWKWTVASSEVPKAMRVGKENEDGWIEWRLLHSTIELREIQSLECEYDIQFASIFRAYLLARHHLFDQIRSRKYGQVVCVPDVPSHKPLKPVRAILKAWKQLIQCGYIPFAEWGDGWGPMCFDTNNRTSDGDCPIVWLDHDSLNPAVFQSCRAISDLSQPLYSSCREFLIDVFGGS